MSKIKIERIASQIIRELSNIIFTEVKDEKIKNITIIAADLTPDLGLAKIYYTFLGNYSREEVQNELDKAASFLRTLLAENIDIRHTPELKFIYDESIEYGANIEKILEDINSR
ncbi:MAG: 30S ribosome-binding factor RbfA [Bacilli bacterium]|nr:30S ribosome-binding factor RbfA [Bacilli bacterium]